MSTSTSTLTSLKYIVRKENDRTLFTIIIANVMYHYIYEEKNVCHLQQLEALIENLLNVVNAITQRKSYECATRQRKVCHFSIDSTGHFLQVVVNESPQYVFIEKKNVLKKDLKNLLKSLEELREQIM